MKTSSLLFLTFAASIVPLQASENIIANGNFEDEPRQADGDPFYQTPGWYNRADRGKRQDITARTKKETLADSVYAASVNNMNPANSVFLQRTKHQIKAGEVYQLALDFRHSYNWHVGDVLRVTVFATLNDELGGAVVWEDSADLESPDGQSWSNLTHTFQPAHPDADGKRLFFSFQGFRSEETVNPKEAGYARVDNIVLTVAP